MLLDECPNERRHGFARMTEADPSSAQPCMDMCAKGGPAAMAVDGALRDPSSEARLRRTMQKRLKRGPKHFSWFIHRFNSPVMERLSANPRNTFQAEQALIPMLA